MIMETSQEFFSISIFVWKHQARFYNVLVLHKLYGFVWLTGSIFHKLNTR